MATRREFLGNGLAALALGLAGRRAFGAAFPPPCLETGALPLARAFPIRPVPFHPPSTTIAGLPFHAGWLGDDFASYADIPFHHGERGFPGGSPPPPSEDIDIAIIGGGLSGLATAYLLRRHRPVVFELHDHFGGTTQGESWAGTPYSLGGAYFITPDPGSDLERLYRELGLNRIVRVSPPSDDPTELNGQIVPGFWDGLGLPDQEREAFRQYAALVQYYVENYPSIPLIPGEDNEWIRALDRITFRDHIYQSLTVPVPSLLAAAIQGYFYSSFGAGWEEVSAASGWNFVAAEEYGRWVLPGGNTSLIEALWDRLALHDARARRPGCPPDMLRAGCRVVDVKWLGRERMQVTYRDRDAGWRSVIAKRVVFACPKHIARQMIADLAAVDPARLIATQEISTAAYVVANVLLNRPVSRDFYDLFLLRDGKFPPEFGSAEQFSRVVDAVKGDFTARHDDHRSVLTLYWPLPFPSARFTILADTGFASYAEKLAPQIDTILGVLGLDRTAVRQVRMARWGHAMPIARPGLIANGVCETIRSPYREHMYFVQADNWALPAVETCLLEALDMAPLISQGLR